MNVVRYLRLNGTLLIPELNLSINERHNVTSLTVFPTLKCLHFTVLLLLIQLGIIRIHFRSERSGMKICC